jgi:hypothetical protein
MDQTAGLYLSLLKINTYTTIVQGATHIYVIYAYSVSFVKKKIGWILLCPCKSSSLDKWIECYIGFVFTLDMPGRTESKKI